MQLGKSWLIKILFLELQLCLRNKSMPGEKPEVNSYHVLEIHSHSVWDSSHEQIGRTSSQRKKMGQRDILNFKLKAARSLSRFMCVSILRQHY